MSQSVSGAVKKTIIERPWGAMSMIGLYLSVISGMIIALQYDSAHPYYSISSLELLAPFGAFWRSLHFFSSQIFFLMGGAHLIVVTVNSSRSRMALSRWLPLVLAMAASLLLLFTGYILRADGTGASAGVIAENILLSVPLVGRPLDSLLLSMNDEGMKRVYANHLVGIGILWLALSWEHIRRYRVSWRQHLLLVVSIIIFSSVVKAPIEPERLGVFHINGPWFFVGLQELLRYAPPFWAGIAWPLTLVAASVMVEHHEPSVARRARWFCLAWLAVYAVLTSIGFSR